MKSSLSNNSTSFFESTGITSSLPKVYPQYEKTNDRYPTAGKFTCLESAEFTNLLLSTSTMATPWSNTTGTLMDSENMSCGTGLSSGISKLRASSITTRPSIFMHFNSSSLTNPTQISPLEPNASSSQDLSTRATSGPSSTPSLADSTPHHMNSSWTATSSLELTPMPKPNGHDSRSSDDFQLTRDVFFLTPSISIFVNEPFPFVRFQDPFSIPFCIDFPNHSGPPFVRVRTDPTFNRHFNIHIRIRKIAR